LSPFLQNLEPHGPLDVERRDLARVGHEPPHPFRETQVVSQVIAELGRILERDRVPEPTAAPRAEELLAQDLADRFVGQLIVRLRWPLAPDRPDHAPARGSGANPR